MDWEVELISLYLFVCKHYQKNLSIYCQRMSNYADLRFSDEEVLTLYLHQSRKKKAKEFWIRQINGYQRLFHRFDNQSIPSLTGSMSEQAFKSLAKLGLIRD